MNLSFKKKSKKKSLNLVIGLSAMLGIIFNSSVLATSVSIEDSRGEQYFDTVPERVVVLSWSQTEQVVNLGIMPVGMADTEGYDTWVAEPALDETVADVGLRQEPNLERIAELAPDVILISDDQIDFARRLERIAPVVHMEAFSADHDNVAASRSQYLMLAQLFNRQHKAEMRLAKMDARIAELADQLYDRFEGNIPVATVVRFIDAKSVAIYGDNGMTTYALTELGIANGYDVPASTWGLALHKVPDLGAIERGHVMHISPFDQGPALFDTALWQAMPFVDHGRFHELPALWTYGGALSVERIAEAIATVMLDI